MRKSVAHAGYLSSEELPPSFRPGLGSLGLPGSQEKLAGKRTRAQGFLGHVVVSLPRPHLEAPLNSLGLHVSHSQSSATFGSEFSFELSGEIGLVSASRSHNALQGLRRLLGAVVLALRTAFAEGEGGAAGGPGGLAARVGAIAASASAASAVASSARAVRCCAGRARRGRRGRHGARLGD